ncbi:MAG: Asp-tRNA(Asn)/Glu-tRNA(Gln) amidotransferase subunit GatC [Deltaproteobacteria bacterium]|jgi:aspartyl-tRNA(Asn)/glutamyl-tRNA(Gln) amidotransferase subunit C|nr:Asp-tRNA(Asn)/Glu-tRNA(Gln) amidotransferase subunit GatC [Deltaproteobacteria bacterium]
MPLDEKAVLAVVRLARLDPPERPESDSGGADPVAAMVSEFAKIVDYMAILNEAETEGVEPMYSPMIEPQPPRPDEPRRDADKADDILGQAPERVGRYFSVPRIF